MNKTWIALILAAGLTACGDSSDSASDGTGTGGEGSSLESGAEAGTGDNAMAAAGVDAGTADLQRLDCKSINEKKGEGPDIAGVTVGMTAELAFQKIACSNPALKVEYKTDGGFSLPALPDGSQPRKMIVTDGGQEEFMATLVGTAGQERVVLLRRTLRFSEGQEPVLTALVQQLNGKYGNITRDASYTNRFIGGVLRSADNRPVDASNRSLFYRCMPETSGSFSLYEECGTSVGVRIDPSDSNAELANTLTVALTNGKYGLRLIEEFKAHAAQAASNKAQQEVKDAAGRAPSL